MTIRAILGIAVFNISLLGSGLVLLWGLGAVRKQTDVVRFAGTAYLVAVASTMIASTILLVVGIPVTGWTGALTLVALAVAGALAAVVRGEGRRQLDPGGWSVPPTSMFVAVGVSAIILYFEALFRSARLASTLSEWDGWAHWVPRAKAIYFFGRLDLELLAFVPPPSYPPGLPAMHALAFHAMGSADDVTLHLQYWFYALGFTAAVAGLVASRVSQAILVPGLMVMLLAPSFVTRLTWTYADLPLGYLVALAALLVALWLQDRTSWMLAAATLLLAGAMLTKREGLLFVIAVLAAAAVASWWDRRAVWPRIALVGFVAIALALPWRVWFIAHGLPGDGPSTGLLGVFDDLARGWPTTELVLATIVDNEFWLVTPVIAAGAIVLATLARAWTLVTYAAALVVFAGGAAIWTIWSESSLPLTQDDAVNPIVRMTGTSILMLSALTPLLLERAWSMRGSRLGPRSVPNPGPDFFIWRSRGAWAIAAAAALVYPASMLVGYSGRTLPGGSPHFPSTADCVRPPAAGGGVRVVVGYAESYPDALDLRRRATAAGVRGVRVAHDGCGRLRVSVDDLPSMVVAEPLLRKAEAAGIEATLESDAID